MLDKVLLKFGLDPSHYKVEPFGSGLINYTLKVTGNGEEYILQKINSSVFRSPERIAQNLTLLQSYFKKTHPDYLFVGALPSITKELLIRSENDDYYRLFPFVKGSKTINFISKRKEAFEAAKQFGRFTCMLNDFDAGKLKYTLKDFHNLQLRFEQFKHAYQNAGSERLIKASDEIKQVFDHHNILQSYNQVTAGNKIPLRVIHHDTKISNVLFDKDLNGICVIDLDTVMPGYYLSDVGDMMRTYLSPANEEETDFSKIHIREDIFGDICKGYMIEMGEILTETEKKYFIFSGKFMIYMQAIRFLTDFLNGDIYYEVKYPDHNLTRAKNQFDLLNKYIASEEKLNEILKSVRSNSMPTNS